MLFKQRGFRTWKSKKQWLFSGALVAISVLIGGTPMEETPMWGTPIVHAESSSPTLVPPHDGLLGPGYFGKNDNESDGYSDGYSDGRHSDLSRDDGIKKRFEEKQANKGYDWKDDYGTGYTHGFTRGRNDKILLNGQAGAPSLPGFAFGFGLDFSFNLNFDFHSWL
ncbi:hypothetical protein AKK44_05410 [Streptococcus phocae]|uniref:Uncharacterized protein n=2 Tax=Streptococcus phocae TaxID=119224 RepID=A0A0P6S7L1_9STRE|nr:hypothetical protein AKK44_05410 [Streptococcus phocae]